MSPFARAAAVVFFVAGAALLLVGQFSLTRGAKLAAGDRLVREGAVVLPAAASRLALCAIERRVAYVSEESSRSLAGAFHHRSIDEALSAYRSAGGRETTASALAAWTAGLPAAETPLEERSRRATAGDAVLLPALRALEAESARTPVVPPPAPLEGLGRGRLQLLAAFGVFAVSLACAGVFRR